VAPAAGREAVVGAESGLGAEDLALLTRLADRLVELHLEVPAILTLETARPLSLVAGQALVFFEPILRSLFRLPDYDRFRVMIQRRETLEAFTRLIEQRADAAREARLRRG
jgi:hypothetical protein